MRMLKHYIIPLTFLLAALVLGGCGSNPPAPSTWNFLVYMNGDNSLEHEGILDLNEMETVGSTDYVNILVLFDRRVGDDASNGDWTDTRLFYVTKDTNTSLISSTWLTDFNVGELDMADPATLRDFIVYCQTNYPADHTVLTLWNHGGGVYPRIAAGLAGNASASPVVKGISWDDSSSTSSPWNCLTTDEVALALSEAGTATRQKVDIINTDACLMQMLEVAYEWRDATDYLVGSEETVPGEGNDYAAVLSDLSNNAGMTTRQCAIMLVDDYYDYYKGSGATTYSALDLGAPFAALVTAFGDFAAALDGTSDLAGVEDALVDTTYFAYHECRDLANFCANLTTHTADADVADAASRLKTAVTNAVIDHHETGIYVNKAFGLSVLMPDYSEWQRYNGPDQYVLLQLSIDTQWDEFIADYAAYTAPF